MFIFNMDTVADVGASPEVMNLETTMGGSTSADEVGAAFDQEKSQDAPPEGEQQVDNDQAGEGSGKQEGQEPGKDSIPEYVDRIKQFMPDVDTSDPKAVTEAIWEMYRGMEKVHTPVVEELKGFKETADSMQNMKQLVDWINENPERAKEAQEFVSELQQREARNKFGEELPDNVLKQLSEAERTKSEVAELKQQLQNDKEDAALDKAMKDASSYAKDRGKEFDETKIMDYMNKNSVMNPLAAFKAMLYETDVVESKRQGELAATKKIQDANKDGVVFHKGNSEESPAPKFKNDYEADQAMMKEVVGMLQAREDMR